MGGADLPAGYTWRHPTTADLERILALMVAVEGADAGEETATLDDLQGSWERARFDPANDAWIAEIEDGSVDGTVAAYGEVWPREGYTVMIADGYVHPAHRGKGLGRWLVRTMEARAREMAENAAPGELVLIHNTVNHAVTAATELLESEGYTPGRYFWRMLIHLDTPPAEVPAPEGVTFRTFRPEDEHAVHELIMTAFKDNEGHQFSPFEEWRSAMIERETYNPQLFFVAEADGEIIGAALCPDYEGEGWIRQVGVRHDYRGRGIAHALLRHVFARQYEHGNRKVGLVVDSYNRTNAKSVYERAGMHNDHQFDAYEKALRA